MADELLQLEKAAVYDDPGRRLYQADAERGTKGCLTVLRGA